jgi:hypothetical protein
MVPHVRFLAGAAFLSLSLAGCHGSSPSGVVPTSAQKNGSASFSVFVPAPAAGVATPQSLVVSLTQASGATPGSKTVPYVMNLSATSHGCAALAGGAMTCTATVSAPAGTDTFSLTTYSGVNGTGKQIATSQAKAIVIAGGKTACIPTSTPSAAPTAPN